MRGDRPDPSDRVLPELTDEQRRCLDLMLEYRDTNEGKMPSVRILQGLMGCSSPTSIKQHLDALEKKGRVVRGKWHGWRNLHVIRTA